MTTPTSTKGRARRDQILDASAATLIEAGYAGFSLRKSAERLGIRLSNLQYYFPTLEELLSALFDRELEHARERFATAGSQTLEALVNQLLDDQQDPGNCRLFWELWALAARNRDITRIMADFYARYSAAIETLIAAAHPEMPAEQRQRRAVIVTAMIEGLSLFDARMNDDAMRQEVLRCVRALTAPAS